MAFLPLLVCLLAVFSAPVVGDAFSFKAGKEALFSVNLSPEKNASGSGSATVVLRRARENSSAGFAEWSGEVNNLSLSGLASPVVAIHIHRGGPDGPIILLACGSRDYPKISPDVVALTQSKTYPVPATTCNVPSQTRYTLLPLARDASGQDASSVFGKLIDEIHAFSGSFYLNVHTIQFQEGQVAGPLVRTRSFIDD